MSTVGSPYLRERLSHVRYDLVRMIQRQQGYMRATRSDGTEEQLRVEQYILDRLVEMKELLKEPGVGP